MRSSGRASSIRSICSIHHLAGARAVVTRIVNGDARVHGEGRGGARETSRKGCLTEAVVWRKERKQTSIRVTSGSGG
jgi:hypothetical protein